MKNTITYVLWVGAALLCSGCVSGGIQPSAPRGVISDDVALTRVKGQKFLMVHKGQDGVLAENARLCLEDPQVIFSSKDVVYRRSAWQGIHRYLKDYLTRALSKDYNLVASGKPCDAVLVTAMVGVQSDPENLNIDWASTMARWNVRKARFEMTLTDRAGGQLLSAARSTSKGEKTRYRPGMQRWGHSFDIPAGWSIFLKDSLEQSYENPPSDK